jgi:SAM-dependent methyltransferase
MDQAQYVGMAGELARDAGVESGLHQYFLLHRDRLWRTGSFFGVWGLTGKSVLEIGPFFSYTPFVLKSHGSSVTVLEGDDTAVYPLKPLYAKWGIEVVFTDLLELFRGLASEGHRLPFPDQQFDVISCWETMEHFNFNPVGFVKELHRILKPGGAAFIAVPNLAKLDSRLTLLLGKTTRTPIAEYCKFYEYEGGRFLGFHWREYVLSELVELFAKQNFKIESAGHLNAFQHHDHPGFGRRLKRLLGGLACAIVPSCGSVCCVVARK